MKLTWDEANNDWKRKTPREVPSRMQMKRERARAAGQEVEPLPHQYTIGALEGEINYLEEYVLIECPTYEPAQRIKANAHTQRLRAAGQCPY